MGGVAQMMDFRVEVDTVVKRNAWFIDSLRKTLLNGLPEEVNLELTFILDLFSLGQSSLSRRKFLPRIEIHLNHFFNHDKLYR